MIKRLLLFVLGVASLGMPRVASATVAHGAPVQHDDNVLRVPFHEIVACLNSSMLDDQWHSSHVDLVDGLAKELDEYFQESFASGSYIRTEGLNVILHESLHASKSESARSFLRQQDYLASHCELDLELKGIAILAVGPNKDPLYTKPTESQHNSPDIRHSTIYARVLQSVTNERNLLTKAMVPSSAKVVPELKSIKHRHLLTCPSTVESFYSFTANEFMCSPSGPFFFGFGSDGDLGIWKGYRKVWSAETTGDDNRVTLQPDGNLVVRDKSGVALWDSRTNGDIDSGGEVTIADNGQVSIVNTIASKSLTLVPELNSIEPCSYKMESIARLFPGERICSQDERYSFGLTLDGVLGIFFGPKQVWSAGTCCKGDGTYAHLQTDGNFVIYSENRDVLWESGTDGPDGSNAMITISTAGIVTITNEDAGKTVTIEPFDEVEPPVQDEPDYPDDVTCVAQVSGRIDLRESEFICSPNGRFRFGMDEETGDLTLFDGPDKIWSAGTCCKGDDLKVILQMSDGNLVVVDTNLEALWTSATGSSENANSSLSLHDSGVVSITNPSGERVWTVGPEPVCLDQVDGDFEMSEGRFICSPSGEFKFGVSNGDLTLYDGNSLVWSAGLSYSDGVYAHMQADGNLVVRNKAGDPVWTSRTSENVGSSLRLGDDGDAKIVSVGGTVLWSVTGNHSDQPPTQAPPTPSPPTPSPPPPPPPVPCRDPVGGGDVMAQGDFVCSPNGVYKFGLASDGDLVLYEDSREVWSANTCCSGEDVQARLQRDGNLVAKTVDSDEQLWASNSASSGTSEVSLSVGNDGIVTITDTTLGILWSNNDEEPPTPPGSSPTVADPPPTFFKSPPLDPSLLKCRDPVQGPVLLEQGDVFCSRSGTFKFGLAPDGDLALFEGSRKIWSAETCCTGEKVTARVQVDGNLVVSTSNEILWTSESASEDITRTSLVVGDDGVVTITDTILGHIWSSAITNERDQVSTNTLVGKVMAGYQGWFFAKGDTGMNQWIHWSRPREVPSARSITIDAWPDLRELDENELYPTQFTYNDGSNAGLYSSHNAKTTERHTKWMKDYGVHGVFVQRFIGNARAPNWTPVIDTVLGHIRSGAEKYGRTFVNMYDIGNGNEATIVEDIINDWKHLVDDEHITKSKAYLYHRGRPLVAIWGFGFYDRLGRPEQVARIIDWFQNKAEDKYKATLMGGVPTGWRDLSRDSQSNGAWANIYRSYDVISPWAVGRLVDVRTSNFHRTRYWQPDLAECDRLGIDYLPVVFPGFSFNNLKPKKPFNEIPRDGGRFMWHQMHNAVAAGNKMIYVAMFDEVDESTAIYKIADNQQQTPREGKFLAADTDGYRNCPGDWYLNITGTVAGLIEDGKGVPANMPAYP